MTVPQDRIEQLEAQVASLTERLEALLESGQPAPKPPDLELVDAAEVDVVDLEDHAPAAPAASRRNLLKLAAGAAAGGAVVAASSASGRVAAADGDPLRAAQFQTTTAANRNPTGLAYTNTTGGPQVTPLIGSPQNANIFLARDTDPDLAIFINQNSSAYPAALAGYGRQVVPNGVYGFSANEGHGVVGFGATGATGMLARGGRANLEFYNDGDAPAARSDAHSRGEVIADSDGTLWYCTAAGSPGTWQRLGAAGTAGALTLIAPARVYDSRSGQEPLGVFKGRLNPGDNRAVDCTVNSSGVPADAKGVLLNLTAAGPVSTGNLAVYPDGTAAPATSTVNYRAGQNIANATASGCGPGAKIRVQCGPTSAGGTDFLIDIVGYYL